MHQLTKLFFTWGRESKRFCQISGLGHSVLTNEISEIEPAFGGALHKIYSFLPAQYCFVDQETSPNSRFNLPGRTSSTCND